MNEILLSVEQFIRTIVKRKAEIRKFCKSLKKVENIIRHY